MLSKDVAVKNRDKLIDERKTIEAKLKQTTEIVQGLEILFQSNVMRTEAMTFLINEWDKELIK